MHVLAPFGDGKSNCKKSAVPVLLKRSQEAGSVVGYCFSKLVLKLAVFVLGLHHLRFILFCVEMEARGSFQVSSLVALCLIY